MTFSAVFLFVYHVAIIRLTTDTLMCRIHAGQTVRPRHHQSSSLPCLYISSVLTTSCFTSFESMKVNSVVTDTH